ncbi:MAG: glycosyltransferase family 39 protein [Planctomycetota bacterium]|nr:glycosyltransferase family 39 protein [Planctomycetota bacterium]
MAYVASACTPRLEWNTPASAELSEHVARAIHPVLRVRLTVALLSLLVLPATWRLARLVMPPAWALVAAALAGTSLLSIHFAVQARPHAAAASLMALAVLTCVRLRRRPRAGAYLLASLAVGAALGSLQSGVAVFLPLILAHVLASHRSDWRRHLWALLFLLAAAATVVFLYPFLLEGAGPPVEGATPTSSRLGQSGPGTFRGGFNLQSASLLMRSLWSWEPALAAGAVLGLVVWLCDLVTRHSSPPPLPLAIALSPSRSPSPTPS